MQHTFEVYEQERLIFYSDEHWLHPIFSFETYLHDHSHNRANLLVHDKIIGRAAAMLLLHLGIEHIHAQALSRLAVEILDRFQISYQYDRLIERVACRTEDLLLHETEPQEAYKLIERLKNKNIINNTINGSPVKK